MWKKASSEREGMVWDKGVIEASPGDHNEKWEVMLTLHDRRPGHLLQHMASYGVIDKGLEPSRLVAEGNNHNINLSPDGKYS